MIDPTEVLARLSESGIPPDTESALRISVGIEGFLRYFSEETLPFIAAGGNELKFVSAEYGRGKTHLMKALQQTAIQEGFVTAYVDCRAETSPFASLQDTYRSIETAIVIPPSLEMRNECGRGIKALIRTSAGGHRVATDEIIARIRSDNHLAAEFQGLVTAYILTCDQPDDVLKNIIGDLLTASTTSRVSLGELYREQRWLPRPLGKLGRRNAAAWLRSLASLPSTLGYKGLVILFDETEPMYDTGRKRQLRQVRTHLANLRNFVDHMAIGNYRSCAVYCAVADDFRDIVRGQLDALSQRIERVSLGESRNRRASWVYLDELTDPTPSDRVFFVRLGENLLELGSQVGLSLDAAERLRQRIGSEAGTHADSSHSGAVRNFVKLVAGCITLEAEARV